MPTPSDAVRLDHVDRAARASAVPPFKQRVARMVGAGLLTIAIAVLALLSPTPAVADGQCHLAEQNGVSQRPSIIPSETIDTYRSLPEPTGR